MPILEKSLTNVIRRELRSLHIPPSLLGYHYLLHVVKGVVLEPLRIRGLTKDLYREIARLHATTPGAVERDIRTAVNVCWERGGKEKLDEMAVHHLIERPFAKEFIAIVAEHVAGLKE